MLPVKIIRIPTGLPVGKVNIYLIKVKPYTLIDAGPMTNDSLTILDEALKQEGIRLNAIEQIILTHGHGDHTGLADTLYELTRAKIYLHENDLAKAQSGYWQLDQDLLSRLGIPPSEVREVIDTFRRRNQTFGSKLKYAIPVSGGEILRLEDYKLEIIPTPGHSPGSISIFEHFTGALFSGDHFLAGITPNPVLEPDGSGYWNSTSRQYLKSLRDILQLQLSIIYPGHGEIFDDPDTKAFEVFDNYTTRMDEIYPHLCAGAHTPYAIAKKIYPWVQGFETFLAVSKVVGMLDLMQAAGQVEMQERGQVIEFAASILPYPKPLTDLPK